MTRNWKIAFGALVCVALVSIVYGFVQTTAANAAMREAEKQFARALENREEAEKQRMIAEKTMSVYQAALNELEELREKCK